ncbi:hypothetical protein NQ317_014156 [Molorchus minor]|uniref:RAWUL domain-containing protein n=1 Tax=Molorchus minor TaxID=1323400 RepID=A0ABQ9J1H5_9CUCU|nr:hypothetical protein NQ317_014156 [Molorchus minor]
MYTLLDKTLQDIVYKLVPELFLKEMTRRKLFYQKYPQIACRISPEERGEDTERTIFNPQDFISLSMEYVSADSTPGAISLSEIKNGLDKNKNLTAEENQALIKRFLQCPGMCRVEVLKKFVRNKYNVDTNLFYIDILYKRVPLPDHYTLIDIAYIYSWKRNEPMKFYFRIIDINKASERFDMLTATQVPELVIRTPTRGPRNNGERTGTSRKRDGGAAKRISKAARQTSQNIADGVKKPTETSVSKSDTGAENKCDNKGDNKEHQGKCGVDNKGDKVDKHVKETKAIVAVADTNNKKSIEPETTDQSARRDNGTKVLSKPEIAEQIKPKVQTDKGDNVSKNSVYTNITLNRTNNVEIITKIQKVSNKEGQPIGLNIIKQTVKKGGKAGSSPVSKVVQNAPSVKKPEVVDNKNDPGCSGQNSEPMDTLEDEKHKFFKSIELTAKSTLQTVVAKQDEASTSAIGQKRKTSSPAKNDRAKKTRIEKKPTTRIIIQPKPTKPGTSVEQQLNSCGLQSLIDSCKINIPSSLSITLKESSDKPPAPPPPAKNYIEILKLSDDNAVEAVRIDGKCDAAKKPDMPKLCDNDEKVDQDLSEIAKSLTEKIPMSTTVSQIVGPKPQFPIPVKNNAPSKFGLQPSAVPDVSCKVLNVPKENKLNPRSPQTFQKIFEESIKKPEGSPEKGAQKSALDLSGEQPTASSSKRNILEIASKLYKKTKLEQEQGQAEVRNEEAASTVPKVPIPRLPNQRKPIQKTVLPKLSTSMRSNALGMNYTISVGQTRVNGVLAPPKKEDGKSEQPPVVSTSFVPPKESTGSSPRPNSIPRNISPGLGLNSPRNSPKHSPKSSPVIKHMYAPVPNLMDQLRVYTYNHKLPSPNSRCLSVPASPSKAPSPRRQHSPSTSTSPKMRGNSPKLPDDLLKLPGNSPKLPDDLLKLSDNSPKLSDDLLKLSGNSPKLSNDLLKLPGGSPKLPCGSPKLPEMPKEAVSPKSGLPQPSPVDSLKNRSSSPAGSSSKNPQKASPGGNQQAQFNPNQILEKYNIQNLAQLTASLNFNSAGFGLNPGNQLAALQHAMLLKHFELQNRQNWLNMNQGPLLQYEKYLQSLKNNQSHLLGNIKEN